MTEVKACAMARKRKRFVLSMLGGSLVFHSHSSKSETCHIKLENRVALRSIGLFDLDFNCNRFSDCST